VGIDLGTTYSAVAYVNAQGRPQIIPNEHGKTITPSVIYFGPDGPMVGDEAKEYQASGATEIASFFKRSMGDAQFLLSFYGRDYTPIDLSALVLEHLKAQAERYFDDKVSDAVITVPAYFNHTERAATIEAGHKAGLNVLKIISEPTSAALAYGLRPSQQEQRVLVYDLGGGTFDISLISITSTELNVLATDGDHNLGGKDWDDRLISYLADQFEKEFGIELLGDDVNELRVLAEKLKHTLSARQSSDIRIQGSEKTGIYTVTRSTFEDITQDLMERTQLLTEHVLGETNLTWQDLSGVLPVGGSTRMPMVHDYVRRMSGKVPMGGINPDEAVALGAAIQATMEVEQTHKGSNTSFLLSGRKKTTDVIAHSLGMVAESADRSRYINSVIIRKNLPIPSVQTHPYQMNVRRRGDMQLEVFLTQGESDDTQQCAYLGRYVFSNFPPLSGKVAILDITYEYDKNGLVHISAVERSSGQPLTLSVEPLPSDVPARFAGRPLDQQETREHLTVYLAFDLSGSMSGRPLEAAKQAAKEFVSQCDLTSASVGLISFSDSVYIDLEATQNTQQINRAINSLTIGRTGYGNSDHPFGEIYTHLKDAPGLRYAVVLADGVWSCQSEAIREAQICHRDQIEVIAIGFGHADRKFLAKIASSADQSIFTDLNRLSETFSTIAQELTEGAGEKKASTKSSKLRQMP
jgi:molecular chaperone DnaK